ncbi:MAG: hypothetical protein ACE10B_01900 [Phycisphaerales bacterium]|nr:hypothetical protein [Planctomycetota bacterium]MCZ6493005.1 hypothetical protein [Planctomycetota bacterium]MCZ6612780.1 hypothetical protein [Planctomycetota bacterium]MCZ6735424.1 hypothetical protein [Planctomycetota bacterium]MCZ6810780.1 hypothetical protein [Planctomycetota bacterium]
MRWQITLKRVVVNDQQIRSSINRLPQIVVAIVVLALDCYKAFAGEVAPRVNPNAGESRRAIRALQPSAGSMGEQIVRVEEVHVTDLAR